MIIGNDRHSVIKNIEQNLKDGAYNKKVETDDPVISADQGQKIVQEYLSRGVFKRFFTVLIRRFANIGSRIINKNTDIVGIEKLQGITNGIITCNHFNHLDNTAVRKLTCKLKKKRLNIICQLTNFAMKGPIGLLMKYADTIPLSEERHYMSETLPAILDDLIKKDEFVLIYPEKEMWFNYRVPRPVLRGAYLFSARLNAPIISCFIEMQDLPKEASQGFNKVRYTLHILGVIKPDPEKNVRQNSIDMAKADYELKCAAYEKIYNKKVSYEFSKADIAGLN